MEKPFGSRGPLGGVLFVLLSALAGCAVPTSVEEPTGTVSMQLRRDLGGNAYRLRDATFTVRVPGGNVGAPAAEILTEANPDATSVTRKLAPGFYNITLAPGWRFEKVSAAGVVTSLSAQLVPPSTKQFTVTAGEVTPVSFAFQADGGSVVLGDGDLSLTIDAMDQSLLPPVTRIATGSSHSCALFAAGNVRCWGSNFSGQLGYGHTNHIGDNELPATAGDVNVGGTVTQIAAGGFHTCALLTTGAVRCWGGNVFGQLGYGNTNTIGDNELPATAGDVNVGGTVTQIAAGGEYTCALLTTGAVRCWGRNDSGQLGYGNTNTIGDNELPATAGDVNVGGTVTRLSMGAIHGCALLTTGAVRCWGANATGQLGYGHTSNIGDNELPSTAGDVSLGVGAGATALQIAAGGVHTCALLSTSGVRCWGFGGDGELGLGNTNNIGDNELPSTVPVALSGGLNAEFIPAQVVTGARHVCVLSSASSQISRQAVRCWGINNAGQLGGRHGLNVGDNELPTTFPILTLGNAVAGEATQLAAGNNHTCAIMRSGAVRCWGTADLGQLGYGNTNIIGDDEHAGEAGNVVVTTTLLAASTFPLTVTAGAAGTVASSPAGISSCGVLGGVCVRDFPAGQVVTLTATASGTATFTGWSGDCSGTALTATVTMSQARSCTATFSTGATLFGTPTFLGAGAGVASTAANLTVPIPAGFPAGRLLILQVASRDGVVPVTPAGWTLLFFDEHANPRQRLYSKLSAANDISVSVTIPAGAVNTARVYVFSGVTSAATFTEGAATSFDDDGSLNGPTVTTTAPGRLAVAFVALDSNVAMAPFMNETGGDWTEPVAEFITDVGGNFGLQLQTATMSQPGTIAGGTANFGGGSDGSICRAFALIGM